MAKPIARTGARPSLRTVAHETDGEFEYPVVVLRSDTWGMLEALIRQCVKEEMERAIIAERINHALREQEFPEDGL